ncbi:MAG: MBL fold metallo-hydrolase [Leptospiraceae bacterium]|nr:MBL fold metallo-hydrolase [Leptospiraceae bacterium]
MQVHHYGDSPEFRDIGEGISVISLPQPFYDNNNVYLIDGDEPVLIDSGYVQSLGLLQAALRKKKLSLAKIKKVFYTHDHVDHITASLVLRSYSPARHYGMLGMSEHVGNYSRHLERMQMAMNRLVYKANSDYDKRRALKEKAQASFIRFLDAVKADSKVDPVLKMDVELQEGDVVSIGKRELGFIYTPGHNRWHLTPYLIGEGIYFTGDLVLKNISSVYAEVDGNLQHYKESLSRLLQLPVRRLLPAHGEEPVNPQRAIKILMRTIGILERGVLARLQEGYTDLRQMTVSAMGEKVEESSYYPTALAVMHSFIAKYRALGAIEIDERDPPYECYRLKADYELT